MHIFYEIKVGVCILYEKAKIHQDSSSVDLSVPLLHDLFGILVRFTQQTNLFIYGFKKIQNTVQAELKKERMTIHFYGLSTNHREIRDTVGHSVHMEHSSLQIK